MSDENFSKRIRYNEIDLDAEEGTPGAPGVPIVEDEESGLPEKSNSLLSSLDDNDKKNKSAVWDHFNKFVDNKGIIWAKCRYCG